MAKVLVSIDDKLLRRLDREAAAHGLSRSAYIADLAARDVGMKKGPGADPRARRALARIQQLAAKNGTPGDPVALIRAQRDERTAHLARLASGGQR